MPLASQKRVEGVSRLGPDWVAIGSRLGPDWVAIGSRLGRDWVAIRSRRVDFGAS